MRPSKKQLQPPVPSQPKSSDPATPSTEGEVKTIILFEKILTNALDPDTGVTCDEMCDLMEMFITVLHLRKVTREFWIDMQPMCMSGVKLATQLKYEAAVMKADGATEQTKEAMQKAVRLSLDEISALRSALLKKLELLKQCPLPGTVVH